MATLSTVFFGMLNAVSVLVSHQHGANDDKAISKIIGQAYILGLILIILILSALSTMSLFLHWSHQPPVVLTLARQYMHSLFFMMPGLVMVIINEQFLMGIGRAKLVLHISFMVVPLEILM